MTIPIRRHVRLLFTAGALCAVTPMARAPVAMADPPGRIEFLPESKIWLEGDSTLHPYKSTARQWQISAPVASRAGASMLTTSLEVAIAVRGLKSGEGALDENLYRALNADRHPTIRFSSKACRLSVSGDRHVEAVAEGRLSVAGAERATSVVATGTLSGNTLRLSGVKELKMSDFGVKPPVLLGGVIRCSDRITIHYDLVGKLTSGDRD